MRLSSVQCFIPHNFPATSHLSSTVRPVPVPPSLLFLYLFFYSCSYHSPWLLFSGLSSLNFSSSSCGFDQTVTAGGLFCAYLRPLPPSLSFLCLSLSSAPHFPFFTVSSSVVHSLTGPYPRPCCILVLINSYSVFFPPWNRAKREPNNNRKKTDNRKQVLRSLPSYNSGQ